MRTARLPISSVDERDRDTRNPVHVPQLHRRILSRHRRPRERPPVAPIGPMRHRGLDAERPPSGGSSEVSATVGRSPTAGGRLPVVLGQVRGNRGGGGPHTLCGRPAADTEDEGTGQCLICRTVEPAPGKSSPRISGDQHARAMREDYLILRFLRRIRFGTWRRP